MCHPFPKILAYFKGYFNKIRGLDRLKKCFEPSALDFRPFTPFSVNSHISVIRFLYILYVLFCSPAHAKTQKWEESKYER